MLSGMTAGGERSSEGTTVEPGSRARRRWALIPGALLLVIAVALVLIAVGVPVPGTSGETLAWRTGAGFAVSAVAFALAGVGIYRMARAGVYDTRAQTVVTSFSREQRRDAVRAVRRGEAVPQASMPVATAMAAALVRQGRAALLYAGIALTGLGTALRTSGPWWVTLLGLSVVASMAVAIPLLGRDARLGRRWLDAHQQQMKAQSAGS